MSLLDQIIEKKGLELLQQKAEEPLSSLLRQPFYRRVTNPVAVKEPGIPAIIAEFKRRSPSRGPMNSISNPTEVARAYEASGVAAMSILTDSTFFGGSLHDLMEVRKACPDLALLRKDFIIDPYQVHQASAYGADMILLIAAILDRQRVKELALEARALGLEVLLEVHEAAELEKYHPAIHYVGVNNRDLRNFRVDTGRSLELLPLMPEGVLAVSESGLSVAEEIRKLSQAGFRLFLMGESFMRSPDPGAACRDLIRDLLREKNRGT